jgi:shikimate kinase
MIVLIGFMGAGKSTVGLLLAERLGVPFEDSDQVIERAAGRSVRDIFAEAGEPAFRDLERAAIRALVRARPEIVLALGGGAVDDARTRSLLAGADVVHLEVSYQQAMDRVAGDELRPLLRGSDPLALYHRRQPVYQEVATVTVPTDGRPAEWVVSEVFRLLGQGREPLAEGASCQLPARGANMGGFAL